MSRYSSLAPLNQNDRANFSIMICNFFSAMENEKNRKELGLPIAEGKITPLTVAQLFKWSKEKGTDFGPFKQRIMELILILEQNGILVNAGTDGTAPQFSNCYYFMQELSTTQSKGVLWLGQALGPEFIGHAIKSVLVFILGTAESGKPSIGTGILIMPGIILTCAHVLTDMILEDYVEINGKKIKVQNCDADLNVDVGVIYLEEQISPFLPDIAFRKANVLEQIVIAGYPTIPMGIEPVVTLNRGEICGRVQTLQRSPLELFSAIARPGNSGGPVVGLDGCIVGIVTRSLERQPEKTDVIEVMPFFAAVPSDVIRDSFRALTGLELPWEDYQ